MDGSFRKKKVYFSQVSNNVLRDITLSTKAKGLYAIIQSYITLEDFILYKTTLKKVCKESDTAFESMWSELKEHGYLVQYKFKDTTGHFYYEYDLLDVSEKETLENQQVTSITHTPKTKGVENLPSGKPRVYNKTDLNKTKSSKLKYHKRKKNGDPSDYQLKATADMAYLELRDKKASNN